METHSKPVIREINAVNVNKVSRVMVDKGIDAGQVVNDVSFRKENFISFNKEDEVVQIEEVVTYTILNNY